MKKLLVFLLISSSIYAQKLSPFVINKCTETNIFQSSDGLICSNDIRTRWFMLVPSFENVNNSPVLSGLLVIKNDIGKCSKNDLLAITFKDGSKIIARSTNMDLSCDTWIEFKLNAFMLKMLEIKSIDTIRYINGNEEVKTFVYYLTAKEQDFFVNMYSNFIVKEIYCK